MFGYVGKTFVEYELSCFQCKVIPRAGCVDAVPKVGTLPRWHRITPRYDQKA